MLFVDVPVGVGVGVDVGRTGEGPGPLDPVVSCGGGEDVAVDCADPASCVPSAGVLAAETVAGTAHAGSEAMRAAEAAASDIATADKAVISGPESPTARTRRG